MEHAHMLIGTFEATFVVCRFSDQFNGSLVFNLVSLIEILGLLTIEMLVGFLTMEKSLNCAGSY